MPGDTQQSQNGAVQLQRLAFVPEYGTKGYSLAANAYEMAKTYVPASVKQQINLEKLEESVTSKTAPYVAKAQDKAEEILLSLDCKVDRALTQASEAYRSNSAYIQSQLEIPLERTKQLHNHGRDAYNTARQQYLKRVEDSVSYVKANGVSESAKKAAENVTIKVKEAQKYPSMLLEKVQEAVEHLMALHPLNKAVETVRPQLDAAWTRYNAVHDNVVASEQYKKTYSMAGSALNKAQETMIYQKAKENLYPLIKPYADPAVVRISESQIYNAALTHLAPKA